MVLVLAKMGRVVERGAGSDSIKQGLDELRPGEMSMLVLSEMKWFELETSRNMLVGELYALTLPASLLPMEASSLSETPFSMKREDGVRSCRGSKGRSEDLVGLRDKALRTGSTLGRVGLVSLWARRIFLVRGLSIFGMWCTMELFLEIISEINCGTSCLLKTFFFSSCSPSSFPCTSSCPFLQAPSTELFSLRVVVHE